LRIYTYEEIALSDGYMCQGEVDTPSEINFLKDIAGKKTTGTYFDVGTREKSHVVTTLNGPHKQFHLFEPHVEFYKEACRFHGSHENIKINNFGLGSKNELKDYYEKSQGYVNLKESYQSPLEEPPYKLPIKTLDDYCEENNIDDIDFLKIDTEGYEKEVISGGSNVIENGTKCIQFEYGTTWRDQNISLSGVLKEYFNEEWYMYFIQPVSLIQFNPNSEGQMRQLTEVNYLNFVVSRINFLTGECRHKKTKENLWKNIKTETTLKSYRTE